MSDERAMPCVVVIALHRADMHESIVSLLPQDHDAEQEGQKIMAACWRQFLRCRIKKLVLTTRQVEEIAYGWGLEEGRDGQPSTNTLPERYKPAYEKGHRAGAKEARRVSGKIPKKPRE